MDQRYTAIDALLGRGCPPAELPPPDERRRLREVWGVSIEEVASALNQEPEDMAAWEDGLITADPADAYAYLRLLNGFKERMPLAYEPDWAALRPPKPPVVPPARTPADPPATPPVPDGVKAARHGAPWTPEARGYLRERFLAGDDIAVLARQMGRSELSLRWQLYHLHLVPFPG